MRVRNLMIAFGTGLLVVGLNGGGIVGAVLGAATVLMLGAMALHADRQIRRDRDEFERFIQELDREYGKNH